MSCEQKSGVFLNESCHRTVTETCDNCTKKICHVHFHKFEGNELCEDCYWEKYLYTEEQKLMVDNTYDDSDDDTVLTSSSTSDATDRGFEGGFGGGGFGGGGAAGSWTEGDAKGFDETNAGGGLLDNDDTFYYS